MQCSDAVIVGEFHVGAFVDKQLHHFERLFFGIFTQHAVVPTDAGRGHQRSGVIECRDQRVRAVVDQQADHGQVATKGGAQQRRGSCFLSQARSWLDALRWRP